MAGAPLIIFPSAGEVLSKKKNRDVYKKLKTKHNVDVKVFEREGLNIINISKSDPYPHMEEKTVIPVPGGR